MSNKTEADDRRKFYERHCAGETYAEIAAAAGVSVECIRFWCRRLRDGGSCLTHYHHPKPGLLGRFDPQVRYGVLRLRLEHHGWGPQRIHYPATVTQAQATAQYRSDWALLAPVAGDAAPGQGTAGCS